MPNADFNSCEQCDISNARSCYRERDSGLVKVGSCKDGFVRSADSSRCEQGPPSAVNSNQQDSQSPSEVVPQSVDSTPSRKQ